MSSPSCSCVGSCTQNKHLQQTQPAGGHGDNHSHEDICSDVNALMYSRQPSPSSFRSHTGFSTQHSSASRHPCRRDMPSGPLHASAPHCRLSLPQCNQTRPPYSHNMSTPTNIVHTTDGQQQLLLCRAALHQMQARTAGLLPAAQSTAGYSYSCNIIPRAA